MWRVGEDCTFPLKGHHIADRTSLQAADLIVAPLQEANICQVVLSKTMGEASWTGTTSNFVKVLPLGLQAHLLALLPPQLPAALEVHFLHGCDLQRET